MARNIKAEILKGVSKANKNAKKANKAVEELNFFVKAAAATAAAGVAGVAIAASGLIPLALASVGITMSLNVIAQTVASAIAGATVTAGLTGLFYGAQRAFSYTKNTYRTYRMTEKQREKAEFTAEQAQLNKLTHKLEKQDRQVVDALLWPVMDEFVRAKPNLNQKDGSLKEKQPKITRLDEVRWANRRFAELLNAPKEYRSEIRDEILEEARKRKFVA